MALFTACYDDDIESSDMDTTRGTDTYTCILVVDQTGQGADIINHDGDEIFSWDFDAAIGNDASLLDDGSMLVCLKVYDAAITFEGYGGVFQKINADQTTDWEVAYSTTTQTAHHDVDYLSNGNIIFPVWEQLLVSDIRLLQKVETAPFRKFPIAVKYYGNMPDIIPSRESKPYL